MARIISAPLGEMRGKLGGVVYSRNSYGMIARQHVAGVQPRTPLQTANRAAFGAAAQLFRTLTQPTRQEWATFAQQTWIPLGRSAGPDNGPVQAFVAATTQATRYAAVQSGTITTPQGAAVPTVTPSAPTTQPPCRMPIAAVTSAGQMNLLSLDAITLTNVSETVTNIDVTISGSRAWEGGQLLSYTDPELGDPQGMGIVIWQGAPVPHTGSPTGNLFEKTVATSGIITSAVVTAAGSTPFHVTMEATYIPVPTRDTDKPFLMPVEDVFCVRPITVGLYNQQGLAIPLGTIILEHC